MRNFYRNHRSMAVSSGLVAWIICFSFGGESSTHSGNSGPTSILTGKICVAPIPKINPLESYLGSKPRPNARSVFKVTLDSRDSAFVSSDSGALFGRIDTTASHHLKIALNGSPRENFKFDFKKRGSNNLCLFYRKAYGTWSLEPLKWHEKKCGCPD
jgi:hypothetical protein